MSTILKWAGNKTAVMHELLKHLPEGERLIEPFAGSCSVLMNTDYSEYLISDINPDLINLYHQAKANPEQLKIMTASLFSQNTSSDSYYKARETFNNELCLPLLDRAAHFLYLNRNGYRGLCRYNLDGLFNIAYGNYKKAYFPEKEIDAFAVKAKKAMFRCADFKDALKHALAGDVVYCDPPYIPLPGKSSFTSYHTGGFGTLEQAALVQILESLAAHGVHVVASNSCTGESVDLYKGFDLHYITAPRSVGVAAGKGKQAEELIAVLKGGTRKKHCSGCPGKQLGPCGDCGYKGLIAERDSRNLLWIGVDYAGGA